MARLHTPHATRHTPPAQVLLERVEVSVGGQQLIAADDAARGDHRVEGLWHREPQRSKLGEVPRCFGCNIVTAQNDEIDRGGGSFDSVEFLAQRIDLVGKVHANAPHAPRVGVDGLGLQTLGLEGLEVGLVLSLEMLREVGHDGKSSMGGTDSRLRIECVNLHLTRQPSGLGLLRVAASSNTSFERTRVRAAQFKR